MNHFIARLLALDPRFVQWLSLALCMEVSSVSDG